MQRIIFIVLLAVVSSSAMADWLKIYGDEKLTVYIDTASIRKNGSKVKLWQLIDYSEPQTDYSRYKLFVIDSYLSTKAQFELDCRSEQSREIYFMFQAAPMGLGRTTYASESPQRWIPIVPDSSVQIIWKYACDKKYRKAVERAQENMSEAEKVFERNVKPSVNETTPKQQTGDQGATTASSVAPAP
jgi:hypothetical protein